MNYLTLHWGYPVIGLFALLIVAVHERGLRVLNARSTPRHALSRRRRMRPSYAGIAVATFSVVSPLQYWSMEYFWVHMIQHVTVMLAAPALYVAGAPAIPLVFALPVTTRPPCGGSSFDQVVRCCDASARSSSRHSSRSSPSTPS